MTFRFKLLALLAFSAGVNCYAQTSLPVPLNIRATYAKGTRSVTGEPGKNYWQNRADYDIRINFDPHNRLLSGTVSIEYTNNSPDTLKEIDFKLYPNLYKKGSIRNMPVSPADINDGVQIKRVSINKQPQDEKQWVIDGTNMTVKTSAILPRQTVHFDIAYLGPFLNT